MPSRGAIHQARYEAKKRLDPEWRAHRVEIQRRVRARNPGAVRARSKLAHEVRMGRLLRPECCDICGTQCKPEAHHGDYTKPLNVAWLCKPCHVKEDRRA